MDCEDEGCPHFGKPHAHVDSRELFSYVPDKSDLTFTNEPEDISGFPDLTMAGIPVSYPGVTLQFIEPEWQPASNLPDTEVSALLQFANWFISENYTGNFSEIVLNIKLMIVHQDNSNILSGFTANIE